MRRVRALSRRPLVAVLLALVLVAVAGVVSAAVVHAATERRLQALTDEYHAEAVLLRDALSDLGQSAEQADALATSAEGRVADDATRTRLDELAVSATALADGPLDAVLTFRSVDEARAAIDDVRQRTGGAASLTAEVDRVSSELEEDVTAWETAQAQQRLDAARSSAATAAASARALLTDSAGKVTDDAVRVRLEAAITALDAAVAPRPVVPAAFGVQVAAPGAAELDAISAAVATATEQTATASAAVADERRRWEDAQAAAREKAAREKAAQERAARQRSERTATREGVDRGSDAAGSSGGGVAWSTRVANSGGQGAIDACPGGLTRYTPFDVNGRPYYPIHVGCGGAPILSLRLGQHVSIDGVVYTVVASRDVRQGASTDALAGLGGDAYLQTCYRGSDLMRVVGVSR